MYDLKLSCASGQTMAAPSQVCFRVDSLKGLTARPGLGNAVEVLFHGSPVATTNRGGQVLAPAALSSAWAPL
jgi:hypothetical protein